MNKVTVFGRVVADAELKNSKAGKAFCKVRIASDVGWGENKKTLWLDAMLFGKYAEAIGPHLKKGMAVGIIGELQPPETWENSAGETKVSQSMFADQVTFDTGANRSGQSSSSSSTSSTTRTQAKKQEEFDDDIPF